MAVHHTRKKSFWKRLINERRFFWCSSRILVYIFKKFIHKMYFFLCQITSGLRNKLLILFFDGWFLYMNHMSKILPCSIFYDRFYNRLIREWIELRGIPKEVFFILYIWLECHMKSIKIYYNYTFFYSDYNNIIRWKCLLHLPNARFSIR
jgi:hypothetical protein